MTVPLLKPAQLRIRIADDDMPVIEDLAGRVLTTPAVAAMLVSAAVEAIREAGGHITFPPKFHVDTSPRERSYQLNDRAKRK